MLRNFPKLKIKNKNKTKMLTVKPISNFIKEFYFLMKVTNMILSSKKYKMPLKNYSDT